VIAVQRSQFLTATRMLLLLLLVWHGVVLLLFSARPAV
jgi:hypothetical protein